MRKQCEDCEDTGENTLQAHQSGGEIVDEVKVKCHCHCKCNEDEYE